MNKLESQVQDQSLINRLGLSDTFVAREVTSNGPNKWRETTPIPLIGNNHIICVDLESRPYHKLRRSIGAFLFHKDPDQTKSTPLGYVTYPWVNQSYAEMDYNSFSGAAHTEQINMRLINQDVKSCLERSPTTVGMLILNAQNRAQGLGKMLFLLGAAYLQFQGIEKLRIKNDTSDENLLGESFYSHLGAIENPNSMAKDFDISDLLCRYENTISTYFDISKINPESPIAHQLRIFE